MPSQRFHLSALLAGPPETPFGERLYLTCNLAGGGGVLLSHSADRGERWSWSHLIPPPRVHRHR